MREYLKEARLARGMTMQDVADSFGISRQYYEMIESGERQRKMDITLVAKISDLFAIPMEDVMTYERELYESEGQTKEVETNAEESNRTENARTHHVGNHLG